MIDQALAALARWQAELAVIGALLAAILVVALVYATTCSLVAWIWRTFGPPEARRR